ncbi:hypothetical protein BSZ14_10510 [Sphingomonas sp. Sph1(2015)]|nr:hypothetical protein BSZ14_10510 [Sphingomonas sp. Sph1(2015)]
MTMGGREFIPPFSPDLFHITPAKAGVQLRCAVEGARRMRNRIRGTWTPASAKATPWRGAFFSTSAQPERS